MTASQVPPGRGAGRRQQAAILAADVVGYTRLMESFEDSTHNRLMHLRFSVMEPIIGARGGRVVKNNGDGFMAMFDDGAAAFEAARSMQRAVLTEERAAAPERRIAFRMGLNLCDVIVEDHDVYGDGVNVAARLQTHAEAGGIVITGLIAEAAGGTGDMSVLDLGQMHMRNRAEPVRVLSLRFPDAPTRPVGEVKPGFEARPSVAVLPFRRHAAGEDSYFADGFSENIIRTLSGLKDLLVIARGSTLGFGGGDIDARAIGKVLGVRYVVYGSVQRAGNRLRVATELIDAETARVLRADQYDGALDEIFDFQDRIAIETAKAISPRIREMELRRALHKHPQNMTAYELVLQALDVFYRLDYGTFSRARGLLQKALTMDPGYAPAASYAAHWHSWRIGQGWTQDVNQDSNEAARLATRAIECDAADATALAILGHVHSYMKRDFENAIRCLDLAIETGPSSSLAWALRSATLGYIGDGPNAVRAAEAALRLSPLDTRLFFIEHIASQAHYINGNYATAIAYAEQSATRIEQHAPNLRILIASLAALGNEHAAQHAASRLLRLEPNFRSMDWAERTPLTGQLLNQTIKHLRTAGLP